MGEEKDGKAVEYAEKGLKGLHYLHSAAEKFHQLHEAYKLYAPSAEAIEKGLDKIYTVKQALSEGKELAEKSGLGKGLDAAGKVIAIAETGVKYIEGGVKVAHGDIEGGTQDISRGVAKIALAATGPGALVDYPFTKALQAYAAHDLGRPLTAQEKKDITFTNMAGDGLKGVLKPAGEWLGDQAVQVHDAFADTPYASKGWGQKVHDGLKKTGEALGQGAYDGVQAVKKEAHAIGEKAAEVKKEVVDKAVEVKDAVVEKAADIKKDVVAVADKAVDKVEKAMEKVVPPEIAAKAMGDVDKAMAEPSTMGKLKGLWHAGHDAAKSVAQAHGI